MMILRFVLFLKVMNIIENFFYCKGYVNFDELESLWYLRRELILFDEKGSCFFFYKVLECRDYFWEIYFYMKI